MQIWFVSQMMSIKIPYQDVPFAVECHNLFLDRFWAMMSKFEEMTCGPSFWNFDLARDHEDKHNVWGSIVILS